VRLRVDGFDCFDTVGFTRATVVAYVDDVVRAADDDGVAVVDELEWLLLFVDDTRVVPASMSSSRMNASRAMSMYMASCAVGGLLAFSISSRHKRYAIDENDFTMMESVGQTCDKSAQTRVSSR
jgi:hypothetical protein